MRSIEFELSDTLKANGISSIRYEGNTICVMHKSIPIVCPVYKDDIYKTFGIFDKMVNGTIDETIKSAVRTCISTNWLKHIYVDSEVQQARDSRDVVAYKYSNKGLNLHEAIILGGEPCFISYEQQSSKIEINQRIEESGRNIRPPRSEEYPYTPYEFKSEDELNEYIEKAKEIKSLDQLYYTSKEFFQKYVDQDTHIIVMLASDSILTYFQDLFPIIHYTEAVGGNDVGKSSIGYTFEYIGYRVVKGMSISGANYFRMLGIVEPGQLTIIEDEGDNISDDADKVRILKAGYEYNAKVPRTNINTKDQELNWFFAFCYKMILAEKSIRERKAKGLVDRTFTLKCRPGSVKYSIKKVVSNTINKSASLQRLYTELIDFRKLMLCYRLVHYRDQFPKIKISVVNRDEELAYPALQLFYGTSAFKEVKQSMEFFISQRRERKSNSIEAALYGIIKQLVYRVDNAVTPGPILSLKFSEIWNYIINGGIGGHYNENKPNEYETVNYGKLYNNTLSNLIADIFGATLDKKSSGSIIIFDIEKFASFKPLYESQSVGDDFKIDVELDDGHDGNEGSSDGSGENGKK